MRLHLHDYRSPRASGIVDGAVLMHREVAELLARRAPVSWHDLTRRGAAGPSTGAGPGDVVYAGSGPYAYLYHLWRERTGGDFRIVREAHTALWSGYWAQEELCAPLVRPGDLALFPTEYTRRLFDLRFPSVARGGSAVAYPMLDRLPSRPPVRRPRRGEPLRLGYLGALSLAKNFDQVLSVFARCHRESGGRVTLSYAGKANDPRWAPDRVSSDLRARGVPPAAVRALGVLPQSRLGEFFAGVDVLVFPSTASRETLGRVVLEALAHGVPVLAADVGPAVELLPADNLVPTSLDQRRTFAMDRVEPLGRVDEDALVARLLDRAFASALLPATAPYRDDSFLAALAGEPVPWKGVSDRILPGAVRVDRRPGFDADAALAGAAELFERYFVRRDDAALLEAVDRLPETGDNRERLRRIVEQPDRDLADYRAFPRLLDALVLPPLGYTLEPPRPEPPGAAPTTGGRLAATTGEDFSAV
ncbi:glycosyltransferase [Streptomyces alkaliterrae]|uniref:Glycosyltransferase n=1 Tax=Streptomyces alkaliterrae TaxID=2213162 RepID=A0A5P0YNJ2_9ACTN|nr:glycosyltransferase [Streptomyces alkaliterrae]MBB1259582.1 glycosyltransferase [Streptomyces alkaliterrae]MQS00992.1 glycosyltransferase [Streptomyces alkaliterrae]